jgi:hypothetical protein
MVRRTQGVLVPEVNVLNFYLNVVKNSLDYLVCVSWLLSLR